MGEPAGYVQLSPGSQSRPPPHTQTETELWFDGSRLTGDMWGTSNLEPICSGGGGRRGGAAVNCGGR